MSGNIQFILNKVRGEVFSSEDLARLLGSRQNIKNYLERGEIQKIFNGYYGVDAPLGQEVLMVIKKYYPEAVIGGQSALFYQNLSDYMPDELQLLIPSHTNPRSNDFILFKRVAESQLKFGIDKCLVQGVSLKCVSPERCLYEVSKAGVNNEQFITAVSKYFNQYGLDRIEKLINLKDNYSDKSYVAITSALQVVKESKNIF